MNGEAEIILTPGDVAKKLGVSPSGLRRLAVIYGEVFNELPKDPQGTSRIWPGEAVARLEAARALLAAEQARTIKDALQVAESGAVPPVVVAPTDTRMVEALEVVAARLNAVLASNERLEAKVEALEERIQKGAAQLPTNTGAAAGGGGDETLTRQVLHWIRGIRLPWVITNRDK